MWEKRRIENPQQVVDVTRDGIVVISLEIIYVSGAIENPVDIRYISYVQFILYVCHMVMKYCRSSDLIIEQVREDMVVLRPTITVQ